MSRIHLPKPACHEDRCGPRDFGMLPGEKITVRLNEDGTLTISRPETGTSDSITWDHTEDTFVIFRYNDD